MVKCYKGHGELREVDTDFTARGVTVRGVRGLRCPVCGEESYTEEQFEEIHRLLKEAEEKKARKTPAGTDALPVPQDEVARAKARGSH
jgi:YgiT-type zinc finger domain-containing protein